jgi:alpha-1,6-mannosyltransferase
MTAAKVGTDIQKVGSHGVRSRISMRTFVEGSTRPLLKLSPFLGLLSCGVASAALYATLARVNLISAIRSGTVHFAWVPHTPGLYEALLPAGGLLLIALYWWGYSELEKCSRNGPKIVVGFALVFALLGVLAAPFDASDIYSYANRGWEQSHYHLNPYAILVQEVNGWQNDPMFTNRYTHNPCPYGFGFALIAKWICSLGSGNLALTILLFKLTSVIAYSVIGVLIFLSSRLLGLHRPLAGVYLLLWNPMVILHEIVNGHNDLLMSAAMLLAMYFAIRGWYRSIIPALIAGTLIKYLASLLIPYAFVFVVRRKGLRAALTSLVLSIVLLGIAAAPYLADWSSIRIHLIGKDLIDWRTDAWGYLPFYVYKLVARVIPQLRYTLLWADLIFKMAMWGIAGTLISVQIVSFLRKRNIGIEEFIAVCAFSGLITIYVGSSKFLPWYPAMVMPATLLIEEGHWLRRMAVGLSAVAALPEMYFIGKPPMLYLLASFCVLGWIAVGQWNEIRRNVRGDWEIPTAAITDDRAGQAVPLS